MASYSPTVAAPSIPSYGGTNYNVAPSPTGYSPTFGGIPGTVGLPPSNYEQAIAAAPGLASVTPGVSAAIGANVQGQLAPDVINAIKNQAAAWGANTGTPGSDIEANKSLSTIGQTSQQLQQQGVGEYNQFLGTLGSQQLSPALAAQIAQWNATMKAAPVPAAAEQYLQGLLHPPTNTLPDETYHSFGPGGPHITNPAIW